MKISKIEIDGIPAIIFGNPSNKVYIYVHGKMGKKKKLCFFQKQQ